ncbi:MAG TPA: TIGR00282 family metallophosphoesterase [Sphaerochaeta sp.]|jgi:metallophosphoesterase (TIGR00282 family)|nr:TIGR00282 family metallophosphoesterase [Sphaerochaeta sp.]
MANKNFTTLLLGDIYGDPGCRVLSLKLQSLIKKYRADFVIVNGENAYKGFGIIPSQVDMLFGIGIDVITSGNHIWQQEDIYPYLDSQDNLLRPANYGNLVQGHGYTVKNGVCVMNLQGRMNMVPTEDPFKWANDILKRIDSKVKTIFVDFHAESTEEKEALGFFLDGKVTAVVGTHIHVQTMDSRILPNGTAYITDLGMCGPKDSVIGSDPAVSIKRQLTQMPLKAQVHETIAEIHGVCVQSDPETGRAISIERILE